MKKILEELVGKKTDRKVKQRVRKEKYNDKGMLRKRIERETEYEQDPHCCECEDGKV